MPRHSVRPRLVGLLALIVASAVAAGCESDDLSLRTPTLRDSIGVNTRYASGGRVDGEALARLSKIAMSTMAIPATSSTTSA